MNVTLALKDNYGDTVEVTTEHAHPVSRGEVYLDLCDTVDDDRNAIAALTPETARVVAGYLVTAAAEVERETTPPSPADECGVSGGCGACPLVEFCGDRDPRLAPKVDADAPDVDPAEPKPEGSGCCGGRCG